ncbi:putative glutamine amidotransferase [Dethiosulfatibacter aminovorans DSM 17477]|uniref:Putative glutamine amidotransferase n=1 Tax=Dethiosulfatibacter aminovorans DSM 17477 TaxID=1121476 RepID=A0A1M6JNN9_9FIRM|nr:gamma-glutamyl-gamma-aminobutyrate hydrolase family protein [Dethiosulfatibacter aminovorans]SHJ48365.1 putative glutamine amidotransferase [Dethiosulfatibacter aminovorans DSM 17477]
MKPIIGITCVSVNSWLPKLNKGNEEQKKEFEKVCNACESIKNMLEFNELKFSMVFDNDIRAIEEAGGIPLLLPSFSDIKDIESLVNVLDGILFTGGNDINPFVYNEENKYSKGLLGNIDTLDDNDASFYAKFNDERDRMEIELVKHIYENTDKPMMGICRGMQIINVAMGGSLYQDIKYQNITRSEHSDILNWNKMVHSVNVSRDSNLFNIVNKEKLMVNSIHHQSVSRVGENLKVTAKSDDNIIECIESCNKDKYIMGLQWHPEMIRNVVEQRSIFDSFIKKCLEIKVQETH